MARKGTNEFGSSSKKLSNDARNEFGSSLMKFPKDVRSAAHFSLVKQLELLHEHGFHVQEKQRSEFYYSSTLPGCVPSIAL